MRRGTPSQLLTAAHLLGSVLGAICAPPPPPYNNSSSIPELGAVASESSVCSRIGTDLLEAGGNAADALVGTVFCVGVIGMMHSGIGGGGFMLVRAPDGTYEFIDFREVAPAAAFEDMYKNNTDASLYGGLASGVPGELRGLEYLHTNYGALPWAQVMAPAIKVARDGFRVTEDLVRYMNTVSGDGKFFTEDPSWAIDFAPHGYRVKLNETMTRKRYADTLEVIAKEGPDAFYRGAIAKATVAALQAANGTMTTDDLKNYTVALRKPSNITYRGYKLTACGAPAGGSVALSALKIVESYDGFGDDSQLNLTTHRLDEAIRFAYGERTSLGDPSFLDGILEYQDSMLSDATTAEIHAKISDTTSRNVSYYDPKGIESLETPGTSYVGTADKSGLAISLTTTINTLFGSQVMVPETGVIMNNEMNDFSIPASSNAFGYIPSPANYIRPGKRPLSSISPTIVESADGKLYLVVGSAGGSRIITATIQNIHHVLDRNMTTPQALAQPRLHDQLVPDQVSFEYSYDNGTVAYLKGLGHNVTWVAPGQSTAQALRMLPNGTFEAAGEPRQANSGGFAV
ncbi:Gamma-glutamyltransferase [Apiospora aurea]|uniref:Glutathione hydrolase n=1 Tax=Apiospora aurea TaxID=335848 RepID=A0ABR1QNP5_9PEZI